MEQLFYYLVVEKTSAKFSFAKIMVCGQHCPPWVRIVVTSLLAAIFVFISVSFGALDTIGFDMAMPKFRETADGHVVPDDGSPACKTNLLC